MKKLDEEKVKQAFEDTIWMAIRYANGRHTYAPSMVRNAIKLFKDVYPDWNPKKDDTIQNDKKRLFGYLDGDWLDDLFEDIPDYYCKECGMPPHQCLCSHED